MENARVKSAVIKRRNAEVSEVETVQKPIPKFSKFTDTLAKSDHWMRNEPLPGGLEMFPQDWRMRFSDLFYPYAEGGPLWIDQPQAPFEVEMCKRKLEAYAKKGVRYAYVAPLEKVEDVLMRLEQIKRTDA